LRFLLDTHVALWAIYESRQLSGRARELLSAADAEAYVSAVSLWEIALKTTMRPGVLPPVQQVITDLLQASFRELALTSQAMTTLERLPLLHKDPFDRMLVSQALTEGLVFLTVDGKIGAYDPDQRFIRLV
jgi:PIN domain nuclease of toxin-antitoxin system